MSGARATDDTPDGIHTAQLLIRDLGGLYTHDALVGTDNRNERSGTSTAKLPLSPGAYDFIRSTETDLRRIRKRVRVFLRLDEGDAPLHLVASIIQIPCPGSCAKPDSLRYSHDPDDPLPVYCTTPGCRDDQGLQVRQGREWLKARGEEAQTDDVKLSVLDRHKQRIAELEAMLANTADKKELWRGRAELLGWQPHAEAVYQ